MRKIILALAAMLIAAPAAAAAPSFSIADGSVREGAFYQPTITKNAAASSYSKITITISDGTAKAGIDYVKPAPLTITIANKTLKALGPHIQTIDNAMADGNRTIIATITAVRNASIARSRATITIADDDLAPPPPQPPLWIADALHAGGFARAKQDCDSIYRSAETDRVGIFFTGVKAGAIYPVIAWGWTPEIHGIAVPDVSSGNIWTLQGEGVAPYVAQVCLEGVKLSA